MKAKISEDQVAESYSTGLPPDFNLKDAKIRRTSFKHDQSTVQISLKIEYE